MASEEKRKTMEVVPGNPLGVMLKWEGLYNDSEFLGVHDNVEEEESQVARESRSKLENILKGPRWESFSDGWPCLDACCHAENHVI